MNGLLILVSFLFLLQSVTNILLIYFIRKWIARSKKGFVNLSNIFEGLNDEHIQSENR